MKTKGSRRAFLLIVMCGAGLATSVKAETIQPSHEESLQLLHFREAGIRGDRSQMPTLIKALAPNVQPEFHTQNEGVSAWYNHVALRALSEMPTMETVPAIDMLIASSPAPGDNLARVVRARIIAECQADTSNGPEAAQAILTRFYKELNLTSEKMSAALKSASKDEAQDNKTFANSQQRPNQATLENTAPSVKNSIEVGSLLWYARAEIADMIYHGDANGWLSLPEIKNFDFSGDFGSLIKVKIAYLAPQARIDWLIDDLSKKPTERLDEDYELQLALDEEPIAGKVALAKLKELDAHRTDYVEKDGKYKGVTAYRLLLNLLDRTNLEQKAYLEKLENDTEQQISWEAKRSGWPLVGAKISAY